MKLSDLYKYSDNFRGILEVDYRLKSVAKGGLQINQPWLSNSAMSISEQIQAP